MKTPATLDAPAEDPGYLAEDPGYLLVVEDEAAEARKVERLLGVSLPEYHVRIAGRLDEAAIELRHELPAAILTDLRLPDSRGIETVTRLVDYAPIVPIVVLTSSSFDELAVRAIDGGAEDFVSKDGMRAGDLGKVVKLAIERRRASRKMLAEANQDPLTGLANRLHLQRTMDRALARARFDGEECAIGYVDIDDFKQINDRYGHGAGDSVLSQVGDRLVRSIRPTDICARIGGDEFVFLLNDVDPDMDLVSMLERMLELIDEPIQLPDGSALHVSVSIGVALSNSRSDTSEAQDLLNLADREMYSAKERGCGYSIRGSLGA